MPRSPCRLLGAVSLLLGIVGATGLSRQTDNIDPCKLIESRIPSRISYPNDRVYNESLSSYYSAQESDLQPACIFTPRDAAEVSAFIKVIAHTCEQTPNTAKQPQFAIRSGGHTIWGGAANIEGGITIDMRAMNSVVLSDDKKVASLGPGGIWSEIYEQLVPYNLTVMGGRVAGIGVGGLATGGKFRASLK